MGLDFPHCPVKEPNSNSFSFKSYPQFTDIAESPLFIFFRPNLQFFCVASIFLRCIGNFFASHHMQRKKIVKRDAKKFMQHKKIVNGTEKNEQGALSKISKLRITFEGKGVGIWFFHRSMWKVKAQFLRHT